jgi:hypothetical protein
MVGERVKKLVDKISREEENKLSDSPLLEEHRDRIEARMSSAGGCCDATQVAEAVRSDKQEYR